MCAKRVLPPDEQFRLREVLQSATLAALMDSRRWEPGDLAFQGGTCLHLAHGSARFSEDLDFMVRGGLSMDGLAKEVERRLRLPADVARDLAVSVVSSATPKNPHAFTVTLGGPDVVGSAKVKIELWQTDAKALKSLQIAVSTIRSPSGAQAFVPTISLHEVLADKVYALGARDRLKPRDVFDLWWLLTHPGKPALSAQSLATRLLIYPRGNTAQTAQKWLESAAKRLVQLRQPATATAVASDLARWLPSSWGMNAAQAQAMVDAAATQLQAGIGLMQQQA